MSMVKTGQKDLARVWINLETCSCYAQHPANVFLSIHCLSKNDSFVSERDWLFEKAKSLLYYCFHSYPSREADLAG